MIVHGCELASVPLRNAQSSHGLVTGVVLSFQSSLSILHPLPLPPLRAAPVASPLVKTGEPLAEHERYLADVPVTLLRDYQVDERSISRNPSSLILIGKHERHQDHVGVLFD